MCTPCDRSRAKADVRRHCVHLHVRVHMASLKCMGSLRTMRAAMAELVRWQVCGVRQQRTANLQLQTSCN